MRFLRNSGPIILVLLSAGAHAEPVTCLRGKIRIPSLDRKSDRTETADYCFKLNPAVLWSKSCDAEKSCGIRRVAEEESFSHSQDFSVLGTPGARLCHELGGEAQVVEFEAGKGTEKLDRCLWPKDGSFVSLSRLLRWASPVRR